MCGRISNPRATMLFADRIGMKQHQLMGIATLPRGYNVPPGTQLPVFRYADDTTWAVNSYHWGMQAKVAGAWRHIINAKSERLESSGLWRWAMRQGRRGLLPVDGFFEWKATESGKQPYYITRRDREPMALATLYGQAPIRAGEEKKWSTCVIVTQPADDGMAELHNRMPLAVPLNRLEEWLQADSQAAVNGLMGTSDDWEWWPVSRAANRPENSNSAMIEPMN